MLNLGEALGSGIFSVPGVVLNTLGSVGLSLSFWVISPIFSLGSWLPFNNFLCACHELPFLFCHCSRTALLHRACQLLSRTIWRGGGISRTGISTPTIICVDCFCYHHRTPLVRVQSEVVTAAPH